MGVSYVFDTPIFLSYHNCYPVVKENIKRESFFSVFNKKQVKTLNNLPIEMVGNMCYTISEPREERTKDKNQRKEGTVQ